MNKNKLKEKKLAVTSSDNSEDILNEIKDSLDVNLVELEYRAIYSACIDGMKKNIINNTTPMEYIRRQIPVVEKWIANKHEQNYTGAMVAALNSDWGKKVTHLKPKRSFNDIEQRKYDGSYGEMNFDELEKKLLGWK